MTPAPPADLPWLAWAIVIIALALIAQVPMMVQALRTRREVQAIGEQVHNAHESNMREDMDKTHAVAEAAATDAKLAAEAAHRTERLVEDLVKSIRAGEHSADRRDQIATKALAEVRDDLDAHLNEIPQILDRAFADHCPRIHGTELEIKRP